MMRYVIHILAALLLVSGCQPPPPASDGSTVSMQIGKGKFLLEVAASSKTQEHGLMDRDSMAADHGMIFVFKDEQMRNFWMKDTRIALDIIFIDSTGRIVSIRHMQPMSEENVSSLAPAKYAIELNLNAVAETGVNVGDRVEIPASITGPAD